MREFRKRMSLLLTVILIVFSFESPCGAAAAMEPLIIDMDGFPMTAQEFTANLSWAAGDVGSLRSEAEEVGPTELAATGQTLVIRSLDGGQAIEEYPIVVMGDVLGTGQAGMGQIARLARALSGQEPLEGIWLLAGDLNGSGGIDLADVAAAAQELRMVSSAESGDLITRVVPAYVTFLKGHKLAMPLYFTDGADDIPYVSTETMEMMLSLLTTGGDGVPKFSQYEEDDAIVLSRTNGGEARFDFEADTIAFSDYNAFLAGADLEPLDFVAAGHGQQDGRVLYIENAPGSYLKKGRPVEVRLGDYGIDAIRSGRTGYIPLQTFSDMFLSAQQMQLLWNKHGVYMTANGNLGGYEDAYYAAQESPRSPELAEFTYNELCLALDHLYGLKEEHNIEKFDTLFRQTGLRAQLLSTDPVQAGRALNDVLLGYLADLHSGVVAPSYRAGQNADIEPGAASPAFDYALATAELMLAARADAFPDGVPAYQEIGDTAYVAFDKFTGVKNNKYYSALPEADAEDTMGIIGYAHAQITRPGSPIRNVVVDLSCNLGGDTDAAAFVAAWLQGTAAFDVDDALTGAQASLRYTSDPTFDGTCTSADTISHLNRYCLISPMSFSAANLVSASLKGSGVTLLGKQTGGGAGMIYSLSAADGTLLQISGPIRACVRENGAYYEADRGIRPDYPIAHIESFYDREALTAYIHGLQGLI